MVNSEAFISITTPFRKYDGVECGSTNTMRRIFRNILTPLSLHLTKVNSTQIRP